MESNSSSGRIIQSVQRAFDLLEQIAAQPEGARLSELADGIGLKRSTAHNLLASLEGLGYIMQDRKGSAYQLTGKIKRLTRPDAEAEYTLRARIRPVLKVLSNLTGESAFLGLVSNTEYLCVDTVQSEKPLHLAVKVGEKKPLISDALGHVLLAANPELFKVISTDEPLQWEKYIKVINDAKCRGFALDLDHENEGISCVAVAVTSQAAIAIAGPTSRLPKSQLILIAQQIRQELDKVKSIEQGWL
ncbi:IclR family transcriptional regulator [Acinetobacter guillouiae]|uniref:IclR family transcriptional regulator n=1 Tax=Acinetobacter guillouiae TaxID=106649 RepID=UPI00333F67BB